MNEPAKQWTGALIGEGVTFGERCVVGSYVYIGKGCTLGDDVRIQHGAFLCNNMQIGHRVFIGPNVTFSDDRWPRVNNVGYHAEPPILEDDCNIGAGSVILPGVRIGKGATIGAGTVVTEDVPPDTVLVGRPPRVEFHPWKA